MFFNSSNIANKLNLYMYMLFTIIFLLINFLNYYLFMFNNNHMNNYFKFKSLNWKW